MSILIKGMEMPTSCFDCNFCVEAYEGAGVYSCVVSDKCVCRGAGRHDDCPLVPVPPHGRLIDADALMLEIQEYIGEYGWETDEHGWHNEKWCAMKEAAMAIDAAPTILEAEEGE